MTKVTYCDKFNKQKIAAVCYASRSLIKIGFAAFFAREMAATASGSYIQEAQEGTLTRSSLRNNTSACAGRLASV